MATGHTHARRKGGGEGKGAQPPSPSYPPPFVCCKGRAVRQSYEGIIYINLNLQFDEIVKVNF